MFFINYVEQCNKKNISPSAAAEAMGFQRSVVTRWSKGAEPRRATLQKMACFFDCSIKDLTDVKDEAAADSHDEIPAGQRLLADKVLAMNPEEFERKQAAIRAILDL